MIDHIDYNVHKNNNTLHNVVDRSNWIRGYMLQTGVYACTIQIIVACTIKYHKHFELFLLKIKDKLTHSIFFYNFERGCAIIVF